MLERAIPDHLLRERTCPAKLPSGHQPAYPVYMARFPKTARDLVMAIIGVQFPAQPTDGSAETAVRKLTSFTASSPDNKDAPAFSELASVTDRFGYYNVTVLAYWPDRAAYNAWTASSGFESWWTSPDGAAAHSHGWFREIFLPDHEHFESMFNHPDVLEGAAHMRERSSGAIQEHVYWGSMRDRIAAAQTDPLSRDEPARLRRVTQSKPNQVTGLVRVPGRHNLCVIRSGQDWASTRPVERELYLTEMEPTLRKGMDFLRDSGEEVGCYSNRFMDIADPASLATNKDRTFGLGYFDDMASLEYWSREHPTHKAIFGGFLQYNKKLNNDTSLLVFHEVFVVKKDQQLFEYINCHENTGMMTAANASEASS